MFSRFKLLLVILSVVLLGCDSKQNSTSQSAECPQCGMDVEAFKQFSSLLTSDGKTYTFCSNRCMFISTKIKGMKAEKVVVRDYYTQSEIDGKSAFYVIGGDTPGPMGKDLFSFGTKESAEAYLREHAGEQVVTFEQVNQESLKQALGL